MTSQPGPDASGQVPIAINLPRDGDLTAASPEAPRGRRAGVWSYAAMRERQRWHAYLDQLGREPGLVVLASGYQNGAYFVTGLRDPLARDPEQVVTTDFVPGAVRGRWEPFQALHPPFITARATALLQPPAGVTLSFADGRLTARGAAPQRWIDDSARLAPAIAGVRAFDFAGETTEARLAAQVERHTIRFAKGQSTIDAPYDQVIAALAADLQALDAMLVASGRRAHVEIQGYTDSDGADHLNATLSQARAEQVRRALAHLELQHIELTTRGLGRASSRPGTTEEQQQQNRRTSLRVQLGDQPAARRLPQ